MENKKRKKVRPKERPSLKRGMPEEEDSSLSSHHFSQQ